MIPTELIQPADWSCRYTQSGDTVIVSTTRRGDTVVVTVVVTVIVIVIVTVMVTVMVKVKV